MSKNETTKTGPKNVLKAVPTDEKFSGSVTVDEKTKTVASRFTVKQSGDKTATRYIRERAYDFSNVSTADMLRLAERSVRIDEARHWREADNRLDADVWNGRLDVAAFYEEAAKRTRTIDPSVAAERAVSRMGSLDELEALERALAERKAAIAKAA